MTQKTTPQQFSFEKAVLKLEQLAATLENSTLDLDISIKNYEQGMQLVKECEDYLQNAKMRVQKITKDHQGKVVTENLLLDELLNRDQDD